MIPEKTRRISLLYRACRQVLRLYLGVLCPVKVTGEPFPEGPFILSMNHRSALDMFMYMVMLDKPIKFLTKRELLSIPILGPILRRWCIPVDRGHYDRKALERATAALQQGYVVSVFPEGTRHRQLAAQGHGGAVLMAARAGVPIVPGGITGSYRIFRGITVRIGTPMRFAEKLDRQERIASTERLMQEIRSLMAGTV